MVVAKKKVHDLRAESLPELALTFKRNNGQLCGRIYERQLQEYNAWADKQNTYFTFTKMRSALSASSMLVFSLCVAPLKKSVAAPINYLENKLFEEINTEHQTLMPPNDSNRVIAVHVRDFKNEPIIGAVVEVMDSLRKITTGIITDMDGNCSTGTVQKSRILKISYLGYFTQEICIKNSDSVITVTLKKNPKFEEEVVIALGYMTELRKPIWKRILFFPYYQSRKLVRKIKNS